MLCGSFIEVYRLIFEGSGFASYANLIYSGESSYFVSLATFHFENEVENPVREIC